MALPTAAAIEAATLTAWPALQVAHDGLWLWRGARGYTKRANAIHCLDPSDSDNAEERLDRMIALSARNGIPPVFRVTPLTSAGALRAVAGRGWMEHDASRVMVMAMPDADWPVTAATATFDPCDPAWYAVQAEMAHTSAEHTEALRAILGVVACENRGILVYGPDRAPVAAALAAVHDGIGVYVNVVARETERRKGYGRAAMAAALNWSRAAGASHAAIQVLGANQRAINLYASLGFAEIYAYHYRIPQKTAAL